jgi:hypothetical protein
MGFSEKYVQYSNPDLVFREGDAVGRMSNLEGEVSNLCRGFTLILGGAALIVMLKKAKKEG